MTPCNYFYCNLKSQFVNLNLMFDWSKPENPSKIKK
jgi:hypothetical protein